MSRIQSLKNQLLQALRDDLARLEFSIAQARDDEKQAILRMDLRMERRRQELQLARTRFEKAQRRFAFAQHRYEQEQQLYQKKQQQDEDHDSNIHEYHHQRARALQNQHQDLLQELQRLGGSYPPVPPVPPVLPHQPDQPDQPVLPHQPVPPALDQDAYDKLDLLRKILRTQSRNDSYDDRTLLAMYQTWRDTYQAPPRQNRYQTMLVFVQQHPEAFPPVAAAVAPAAPAVAAVAAVAAEAAVAAVAAVAADAVAAEAAVADAE